MREDSKIEQSTEALLNRWGRLHFTEDLGCPKVCVTFKEYQPPGYRESRFDPAHEEADRLAEWMPLNLTRMRILTLMVRYRQGVRHKRKAAKKLVISEKQYREYFNDAIRIIETRFI